MATLTIRNLPDDVYERLRRRAAENKRSMEAEAREIVAKGVKPSSPEEAIRRMQELVARLPKETRDNFTVDNFLAERRKMWGEE